MHRRRQQLQRALRLILWDIDGTIIRVSVASGSRAMTSALRSVWPGHNYSREGVRLAGRCDSAIAKEVATRAGLQAQIFTNSFAAYESAYKHFMQQELSNNANSEVCKGVHSVLQSLRQNQREKPNVQIVNGILSGNLKSIAMLKLRAAGIDETFFQVGAFGCEDENRERLAAIALERTQRIVGCKPRPQDGIVLGDTIDDIACARAAGLQVAAVATGCTSANILRREGADYVLEDLSDTEQVCRILLGEK